jgi:methylated-DNA-[protein]-cysteine S-methyltransferase
MKVSPRRWTQETPVGRIGVVTTARGVHAVDYSATPSADDTAADREIARQLDDWFRGRRHDFDLELDLDGHDLPPLAADVYAVLRKEVPWGETVAYGELAAMVGHPGAARAIGSIMRRNPVPFVIPCHRVIGANGRLGGYGGGLTTGGSLEIKRWLLAHEGVTLL